MVADPDPQEIATTKEWRHDMIEAREAKGLNQEQLGSRVGTSQTMVSLIERGKVAGSQFILPICKVLRIPPPMHFLSETQRRWSKLGHKLEDQNPAQFLQALALIESMINKREPAAEPAPKKKRMRAIAKTRTVIPERASDESPVDVLAKKRH